MRLSRTRRSRVVPTLGALLLIVATSGDARAELPLSIYGDVGLAYQHDDGNDALSFSVARLNLFYSGSWKKLSYLAEVLFEAATDNGFVLDVERVQVTYAFADWLRVSVGRFHTAIGYYNDAHHHGYYFVLPAVRPSAVDFEDAGGLIPGHSIGLHVDGRVRMGKYLALRYDGDVANGRGAPGEVTNLVARRLMKALNLRIRLELGGKLEGLLVGGNIYYDGIPANAGDPTTRADAIPFPLREIIVGAHLAYFEHNVHLISEYLWIQHKEQEGGQSTYNTHAVFGEFGYTFKEDWTPYVRYEFTRFGPLRDPFYASNAAVQGSFQRASLGLRYVVNEHVALKVQGSAQYFLSGVARGARWGFGSQLQCAYAF